MKSKRWLFRYVGLIIAVIVFNFIAFKTNRRLTKNQMVHIWMFTMVLQGLVDLYLGIKYEAYWYFKNKIGWGLLFANTVLVPPVNMMFLNFYPFQSPLLKRLRYIAYWVILIGLYELLALLPEPWGYFHYGWWKFWYSLLSYPLLLIVMLQYYKWIRKIEKEIR